MALVFAGLSGAAHLLSFRVLYVAFGVGQLVAVGVLGSRRPPARWARVLLMACGALLVAYHALMLMGALLTVSNEGMEAALKDENTAAVLYQSGLWFVVNAGILFTWSLTGPKPARPGAPRGGVM